MEKVWARFDFVGVLLNPRRKDRAERVMKRLANVGLGRAVPFWNPEIAYVQVVEHGIPHTKHNVGARLQVTLGHLRMVKTACHLGAKNGLFLEDDICFLKDREMLAKIVEQLPEDYGVAWFDWFPGGGTTGHSMATVKEQVNQYWWRCTNMSSGACYALSREAMERYVTILEIPAFGRGTLRLNDEQFTHAMHNYQPHLVGYITKPQAAIQNDGRGMSSVKRIHNNYNVWREFDESLYERASDDSVSAGDQPAVPVA